MIKHFLSLQEIREKIREERKSKGHATHDAFVFVLMSHGCCDKYIAGTDGKRLNIYKDVIFQFNQERCRDLKGKPKIFVIQACRNEPGNSVCS